MNTNNTTNTQAMTQATITSLTEAVTGIAAQLKDLVDIVKAETTTATTTTEATETTATTTATEEKSRLNKFIDDSDEKVESPFSSANELDTIANEATTTTAPIIVLDDDDSVIGVGFKGSMIEQDPMDPIPAVSEANATEIKNQISVEDLGRIAEAETKKIDLTAIYEILKYSLHKEGKNQECDNSPYAPEKNVMADIGHNCKIYLAEFEDEITIILKHKDYASPLMRKAITILGDCKEQENPTLLVITNSVKAEGDIKRFFDVYGYVKDLIIK